jgi:hypothetical protein
MIDPGSKVRLIEAAEDGSPKSCRNLIVSTHQFGSRLDLYPESGSMIRLSTSNFKRLLVSFKKIKTDEVVGIFFVSN